MEKVTSNEQQLWATLGEQLLAPLLYAAARTDRGIDAVSDWILFRREDEVSMILEELGDRDAEAHWASIRATEGRTKQSIFVTAQRIMHVFSHPLVRGALAPTGDGAVFRPEDLLDTGGTLYVVSPAEEQELFTPIFETLVNSVVRAIEERSSRTGLPIAPRLLLMLEEAANYALLRRLATIASAGRGQGVQLVSVWQDESQIEKVFGAAKARTVMNNHIGHLALAGIKDQRTLERMSDLPGVSGQGRDPLPTGLSGAGPSLLARTNETKHEGAHRCGEHHAGSEAGDPRHVGRLGKHPQRDCCGAGARDGCGGEADSHVPPESHVEDPDAREESERQPQRDHLQKPPL